MTTYIISAFKLHDEIYESSLLRKLLSNVITSTNLRLAALVSSECHTEDEPVESDDVVFPDEVVDVVDALRHETRPARFAKLKYEEFTKRAKVRDEVLVPYALQYPERIRCDS